jgi:uncharacterized protein YndB with AHSA1/START domain
MTSKARGGDRILGSLRSADGKAIVRIEDRYATDLDDLWSALTVVRWFGEVEGDLRPGGQFRLDIESEGWHGTGRVEACEPPRRLMVMTKEVTEPYDKAIEFRLTADGDQTMLVIEVKGMPMDKIAFYGVGWQIHAENLAAYLAGHQRGDTEARWDALVPVYQDLAATIS